MNDDELIQQHIEVNPHKPWRGEVRLKNSAIAVWAIIGSVPAVEGDLDRLAAAFAIPRIEVDAALAYYRRNKCAIDARLEANEVLESEDILTPAD